jgi:hypothetical protein
VHQLFISLKKACDSVRGEFFHDILIEYGIPMKLLRLMEMCLNEKYGRVRVGKHLSVIILTLVTYIFYDFVH